MKPRQSFRISWRAISSHKLRSTLTTLGVIIGVGAVITFMVLGGAIAADFTGEFDEIYGDSSALIVQTQTPIPGGFGIAYSQSPIYTEYDITEVAAIDGVEFVAPLASVNAIQVTANDQRLTGGVDVRATTPESFTYDRFFAGSAFADGTNDAVINTQVSDVFGGLAVGDTISYMTASGERTAVTITGIIEEDIFGVPPTVYVPIDPHYGVTVDTPRDTTERGYPFLLIGVSDIDALSSVQDAVTGYFAEGADATALKGADDTIQVQTVDDLVTQIIEMIDQLTIFVAGIAAIALVVGAIGIGNIMIVSVVERTKEIGIMKAIGAKNRDILQLFLVESAILGIIGAVVGVVIGLGVGALGVWMLDWPMVYPLEWIAIAVTVGIGVGIIAGLYPAWRAAQVDPIVALSHE